LVEPTIGINAYIFALELEVSCEDLLLNSSSEIILKLCLDGKEICVDLDFNLRCLECDGNKIQSRDTEMDSNFEIYPNPTSNIFNIKSAVDEKNISYDIYNASGLIIMNGIIIPGNNMINLSEADNGVYIIKIKYGLNVESRKIVKIN